MRQKSIGNNLTATMWCRCLLTNSLKQIEHEMSPPYSQLIMTRFDILQVYVNVLPWLCQNKVAKKGTFLLKRCQVS